MVLKRALGIMSRYDVLLDKAMKKYKSVPLNSAKRKLADKKINQLSLRRLAQVDRLVIGGMGASVQVKEAALSVLKHKLLITDLGANIATQTKVRKSHLIELIDHSIKVMNSFSQSDRAKFQITPQVYSFLLEQRSFLGTLQKEEILPKNKLVEVLRGVDNSQLHLVLGDELFLQYERTITDMFKARRPTDPRLISFLSMN